MDRLLNKENGRIALRNLVMIRGSSPRTHGFNPKRLHRLFRKSREDSRAVAGQTLAFGFISTQPKHGGRKSGFIADRYENTVHAVTDDFRGAYLAVI
jgi:hypothetical protein